MARPPEKVGMPHNRVRGPPDLSGPHLRPTNPTHLVKGLTGLSAIQTGLHAIQTGHRAIILTDLPEKDRTDLPERDRTGLPERDRTGPHGTGRTATGGKNFRTKTSLLSPNLPPSPDAG